MQIHRRILFSLLASAAFLHPLQAEIKVTIDEATLSGQKAVLKLKLENQYPREVQSVRALAILYDEQNKVVGRKTAWVYGGKGERVLGRQGAHRHFMVVPSAGRPVKATIQVLRVVFDEESVDSPNTRVVESPIKVR